jgi:hypothetical protein
MISATRPEMTTGKTRPYSAADRRCNGKALRRSSRIQPRVPAENGKARPMTASS